MQKNGYWGVYLISIEHRSTFKIRSDKKLAPMFSAYLRFSLSKYFLMSALLLSSLLPSARL